MTIGLRGIANARKLRRLRRWLKRNVLRQPWMFEAFASPFSHEPMLLDKIRCDAYREAIQRTVKPGDVVLDLGAGTGLLSFFALQAGARHVYAIEMTGIADAAAELIEANGFRDRITLIRKSSLKTHLPERSDVLVTETLSTFCFDTENVIEFVADARKRFLKPGGRIIPESADTFLLPISSEAFGIGHLPPRLYDLDYRPLIKKLSAEYRHLRASGKPFVALIAPAKPCFSTSTPAFWTARRNGSIRSNQLREMARLLPRRNENLQLRDVTIYWQLCIQGLDFPCGRHLCRFDL